MKTSSLWRMIPRPWMERKQIYFRIHFHFLFFLQIDFLFNLPTLHPTQWFISISGWKANSDFCQTNILREKSPAKICDDVGEQQTDKVATSLTLKVCCKRRGGEGEEREFLHGRYRIYFIPSAHKKDFYCLKTFSYCIFLLLH